MAAMTEPQIGALARLIAPVAVPTFSEVYWEKRPLVVQRNDARHFADVLTLDDIDRLLSDLTFRREDMRIVDSYEQVSRADYMSGSEVDVAKVFALFEAGSSVVFERLDGKWPPLRRLCRAIEQELRQPAQANVYLTPGARHGRKGERAQGLKRHYDTHDVIVLQAAGSKTWRLFDAARELPLKTEQPDPPAYADMPVRETFELKTGDTLYIPRGVVHEAEATEETSLHVTLGLLSYTWRDLMVQAVEDLARDEVWLRQALPLGIGRDDAGRAHAFDNAAQRLATSGALERAWDKIESHFVQSRRPMLDGQLGQLAGLDRIGPETVVEPRPTALFDIEVRPEEVVLLYHGAEIVLPAFAETALRFAATTPRYKVADVPGGLDIEGRVVLVRRLVKEGLLTVRP